MVLRGRHADIRTVPDERIVPWRYRLDMVSSKFCLLVFLGQGGLFWRRMVPERRRRVAPTFPRVEFGCPSAH